MTSVEELRKYAKLYGLGVDVDFFGRVDEIQEAVKDVIESSNISCEHIDEPRKCIEYIYYSLEEELKPLTVKVSTLLQENAIEERYSQLLLIQAIAEWVADNVTVKRKRLTGEKGVCPICGSSTDLAILEEDGSLTMKCQFCSYEWPTGITSSSISCPYCGYSGREALSLIRNRIDDRVMVLHCGNCNNSLIIVNSKRLRKLPRNLYPLMRVKVEAILAGLRKISDLKKSL